MPTLVQEEVDIYVRPEAHGIALDKQLTEVTVGDLHGNMIKFLFFLIRYIKKSTHLKSISQTTYKA